MRKQGEPKIIWKPSAYQIADFRIRNNMVELKANMKGSYKDGDYSCLGCGDKASVEDQSHVIRCPAYSDIRQGLDM